MDVIIDLFFIYISIKVVKHYYAYIYHWKTRNYSELLIVNKIKPSNPNLRPPKTKIR